jgi:Flp pilus assembly protein TadD
MARIQRERGKYEEAIALLNQAVRKKKAREEVAGLYFMRGDVMARLGRVEEAEADFRREIALFPEDPPAYKNLVLLLVAEGRSREGTQLIRNLIAEAPVPASYLAVCDVLKTVGDVRGVRYWARQGLLRYPNDRALTRIASS